MSHQIEMISLEELIPADHPYRYFKQVLNETFNKFAPRALHLSPRQDRGVLRRRKPKTARYADFKNTNYNAPRGKTTGNRKLKVVYLVYRLVWGEKVTGLPAYSMGCYFSLWKT